MVALHGGCDVSERSEVTDGAVHGTASVGWLFMEDVT
jgi:hypothetical protein